MLTEIISGIWIGDITDIYNEQFYKDNLINIVINCTIDQGFPDLPDLRKLRIPLSSNMDPNNDIFSFLERNISRILSFDIPPYSIIYKAIIKGDIVKPL